MNSKKRIAKWDNIKFFMMACVVIGHTIYHFNGSSELAKSLYLFIYLFHMPVFVFVAGLFSKHTVWQRRYEAVIEYGILYVVMKFLETLGEYLSRGRIRFHFFWEDGPAWFALAMAVFFLAAMLIQNYEPKYMLCAAILIGCLAGLDNHLGDHFASMRICVFFPVFLAGYYTDPKVFELKKLTVMEKRLLRICSWLFLNGCLFLCVTKGTELYPFIKLLKGKYTYFDMGYQIGGVLARLICYGFWAIIILAVIFVNSEKERLYTWLGSRTMAVFLWHNFVIVLILKAGKGADLLKKWMPTYYVFGAICLAIVITIVTSYFPELRIAGKLKKRNSKEDTFEDEM